jgi:phage baseplate assembly protein W
MANPVLGRDLALDFMLGAFREDADLRVVRSTGLVRTDLELVEDVANLEQAVANRLKTRKGELAGLGHPDYGSRHHELMGEPNVERTRNLIKFFVLQALGREPRSKVSRQGVRATIRLAPGSDQLDVLLIEQDTPLAFRSRSG